MIACPECASNKISGEGCELGYLYCKDCNYTATISAFNFTQYPTKLNPPKDRVFLVLTKQYPWTTICHWNGADEKFNYVNLQAGIYEGEQNDYYFENESCEEEDILAWMEMPVMNFIIGDK